MKKKIAVASSDGIVVNAHFGRTPKFYIYELSEGGYQLIEIRENLPGCSNLDTPLGTMEDSINLINDCSILLVSQVGKPMIERLAAKGIKALIIRNMIEDALKSLEEK